MRINEGQRHEISQRDQSLQQKYTQQIEGLQQIIHSQVVCLEEKDQVIGEKDKSIAAGLQENQRLREQVIV